MSDNESPTSGVAAKPPAKRPRGDALRRRVLDTALRLFTRDGYFNTSIHDIRREADVSIGSIYHHFDGKEALAKALYDDLLGRMERNVETIRADHNDCGARCRALIGFMLQSAADEPETMQFMLYARHREFLPHEPPICSSRPFRLLRETVVEGMDCGQLRRVDPWVAASTMFGGALRLVYLHLDGVLPPDVPLPSYTDEIYEAAWRGLVA